MAMRAVLCGLAAVLAWGAAAAQPLPRPGDRLEVPRDRPLPPPHAGDSVANPSSQVALRPEHAPEVPAGFAVNRFAEGLSHARWLTVAPSGEAFLAEPRAGRVTLLADRDGDGTAEARSTFASGLSRPHGLALRDGYLYVADVRRVWRFRWAPGMTEAEAAPEPVTGPNELGSGSGHWTRNIAFGPDGRSLYVAIGSRSNIAEEEPPRAAILRFDFDPASGRAANPRVYASGLRNPVGIAFHPQTGELYTVVNERDGLGDDLVPDYLTAVRDGGFYGWPYSYIGRNPQPGYADRRPDLVARAIVPDLLFRSHSAPLGLVFAAGADLPEDWRDDAFVALHGSWNAGVPRGYMVARVPFAGGRPEGWYEAFATGFRTGGDAGAAGEPAAVFGRPVGLAVAADGSLLVADDVANVVWRISRR